MAIDILMIATGIVAMYIVGVTIYRDLTEKK